MNKVLKFVAILGSLVLSFALLLVVIKGDRIADGSLANQSEYFGNLTGPFESSGSTSRYALVEAIVKNSSFFFDDSQAALATPDLVQHAGKYFSIFAPGVSFLAVPFYLAGTLLGAPQLATYLSTTIIALVNAYLVYLLARKLGASSIASMLSGFIFLFGTNALTYALTLTQHHWSIFIILLSVLTMFKAPGVLRNLALGLFYGIGVLIDIPNAIILLPLIIFALSQNLVFDNKKLTLKINLLFVYLAIGLIPVLTIFGFYNQQVTGSYYKLGQFLGRSEYPPKEVLEVVDQPLDPYQPTLPFYTRLQVDGLYILLLSNERGWLYYSPIVFIGLLGLFLSIKRANYPQITLAIIAMVAMTVLLYASFGDPWGGWSFGPRYLLPATALLCIGLGLSIDRWYKSFIFGLVFLFISSYGIYISTLGAFTTTQVPPKQEAEHLSVFIPYTYAYNQQLIDQNKSGSLVYNFWLKENYALRELVSIHQTIGIAFLTFSYLIFIISRLKNPKL